jgi:DNA-binding NarL/FixJ family response regulator
VTLVLADGDSPARAAMTFALTRHGFSVVAEADDAGAAIAAVLDHRPQMCIVDNGLPGGSIAAIDEIHRTAPETKIAVISTDVYEGDLYDSVRAGADGYLLRRTAPDRLAAALRAMLHGEAALPAAVTGAVLQELRDAPPLQTVDDEIAALALGGTDAMTADAAGDVGAPNIDPWETDPGSVEIDIRRAEEDSSPSALLYLPRFVRHFRRRRQSGMAVTTAWSSARNRMERYRAEPDADGDV